MKEEYLKEAKKIDKEVRKQSKKDNYGEAEVCYHFIYDEGKDNVGIDDYVYIFDKADYKKSVEWVLEKLKSLLEHKEEYDTRNIRIMKETLLTEQSGIFNNDLAECIFELE